MINGRFAGFRKRHHNKITYRDTRKVRFSYVARNDLRPWLLRELTCLVCHGWFEAPVMRPLACSPECAKALPQYRRTVRMARLA